MSSYLRFGTMIITSTVVMFVMMYINTFAFEHVFFSETRADMAVLMGAVMAVIMLAYMWEQYPNKSLVTLEGAKGPRQDSVAFAAPGTTVSVRSLGEEADWQANSELVFGLDPGFSVSYRGFYNCSGSEPS